MAGESEQPDFQVVWVQEASVSHMDQASERLDFAFFYHAERYISINRDDSVGSKEEREKYKVGL